jgi:hypothetical protein
VQGRESESEGEAGEPANGPHCGSLSYPISPLLMRVQERDSEREGRRTACHHVVTVWRAREREREREGEGGDTDASLSDCCRRSSHRVGCHVVLSTCAGEGEGEGGDADPG